MIAKYDIIIYRLIVSLFFFGVHQIFFSPLIWREGHRRRFRVETGLFFHLSLHRNHHHHLQGDLYLEELNFDGLPHSNLYFMHRHATHSPPHPSSGLLGVSAPRGLAPFASKHLTNFFTIFLFSFHLIIMLLSTEDRP